MCDGLGENSRHKWRRVCFARRRRHCLFGNTQRRLVMIRWQRKLPERSRERGCARKSLGRITGPLDGVAFIARLRRVCAPPPGRPDRAAVHSTSDGQCVPRQSLLRTSPRRHEIPLCHA